MRIAVLGAGGPAGVNTCRALHAADHEVLASDWNEDHLVWVEPYAATVSGSHYYDITQADVVYAQADALVRKFAGAPKTFMPSFDVIAKCQDKFQTNARWADTGLRSKHPLVMLEDGVLPDHIHMAADRFGLPFWLRARDGAGARGATLVHDLRTAHHWIRYWRTRGETWSFMAQEFLPGRNFCWTSLWNAGYLVAAFARQRLEWIYPSLSPSGLTGTPTIATTVHYPLLNRIAEKAVTDIDPVPNGIYCVDLVEDADGVPRPTEINAGRWATTSPLYYELGVNLPDLHARLAVGETVEPLGNDIYPEGIRLSRHIDCGHVWSNVGVAA